MGVSYIALTSCLVGVLVLSSDPYLARYITIPPTVVGWYFNSKYGYLGTAPYPNLYSKFVSFSGKELSLSVIFSTGSNR